MAQFVEFYFQNGHKEFLFGSFYKSRAGALEAAARHRLDWAASAVVQTNVTIGSGPQPYDNPRGGFRHEHSADERDKPSVLFFDAIEQSEFLRRCKAGEAASQKRRTKTEKRILLGRSLDELQVSFDSLSATRKSRIRISRSGCWIWQSSVHAPYKNIYIDMKGAVPSGAHLLHVCHDRRCVNPNHLFLGTHLDNMRDKVERRKNPEKSRARLARVQRKALKHSSK